MDKPLKRFYTDNDLQQIIDRLRNQPDGILANTWVAKDYSKLDLIRDLEKIIEAQREAIWKERHLYDEDYKDRCG